MMRKKTFAMEEDSPEELRQLVLDDFKVSLGDRVPMNYNKCDFFSYKSS